MLYVQQGKTGPTGDQGAKGTAGPLVCMCGWVCI